MGWIVGSGLPPLSTVVRAKWSPSANGVKFVRTVGSGVRSWGRPSPDVTGAWPLPKYSSLPSRLSCDSSRVRLCMIEFSLSRHVTKNAVTVPRLSECPHSQSPAQECSSVTREGGVPSAPEVHEKPGREGKPPRRRQSRTPGGTERHGKNYHVTTLARPGPAATPDPHQARSRAPTSRTTRALSAPPRVRRAGSRPAQRAPGVHVDETATSREVTPTMLRQTCIGKTSVQVNASYNAFAVVSKSYPVVVLLLPCPGRATAMHRTVQLSLTSVFRNGIHSSGWPRYP